MFEQLSTSTVELIVALGREGQEQARIDAQSYPRAAAMHDKLRSAQGHKTHRKRKWIAKPPEGWIKAVLGLRQLSMRGLKKVKAEFKLVCMALNLRRMGAMHAAGG